MHSMTGFGAGTAPLAAAPGAPAREVAAEIATVNRKGLELSINLPREWGALEGPLAAQVRERLQRGSVRLTVGLRDPSAKSAAPAWDQAAIAAAFEELRALAIKLNIPFAPDTAVLLRLAQNAAREAPPPAADDAAPAVRTAVAAALEQLCAQRRREGEALARDLTARAATLRHLHTEIAPLAPASVARYREALHARLRQIGLEIDLSDERVLREIALFADRCDVTEELTRLTSHFDQLEKLLIEDGAVGRKLDFLCQELHREFNTIGSKAQHLDVTRRVLEAKNELERIREQVQNVE